MKKWGHGECPHKSPSPCNTCHTCVIIQICVLICHKNTHTHTRVRHTWSVCVCVFSDAWSPVPSVIIQVSHHCLSVMMKCTPSADDQQRLFAFWWPWWNCTSIFVCCVSRGWVQCVSAVCTETSRLIYSAFSCGICMFPKVCVEAE